MYVCTDVREHVMYIYVIISISVRTKYTDMQS
jgi:hypothetical protein